MIRTKSNLITWRKQFAIDLIMAISSLVLPFTIYIHLLFDQYADHFYVFGFKYSHDFDSNQTFVWYVLSSLVNFTYPILIFHTSFGNWRYLLIPIILYFYFSPLIEFIQYESSINALASPIVIGGFIIFSLMTVLIYKLTSIRKYSESMNIPKNLVIRELLSSWCSRYNYHLSSLISNKSDFSLREYSYRIYYLRDLFNQKYDSSPLSRNMEFNQNANRKFTLLLSVILVFLTFILFIEYVVPAGKSYYRLGDFDFQSFGFKDVRTFLWYISKKLVLIFLVIIWFATSINWWRWAILSPILFYSYQFWEGFQTTSDLESSGNLSVFPLVFLTIAGVFLLSRVIRRISINLDYQEFLEEELENSIAQLSRDASGRWVNMKESRI